MQKFTLLFIALFAGILTAQAQTVSSFDTLSLSKNDTFYVNYSDYGNDVGFEDGLAYFPCVYDSAFGMRLWSTGFAYSNMTDTLTGDYTNQYSAITGKGYNGSAQYAAATGSYNKIFLRGKAMGRAANGFYVTNSTYAYHSMKTGDLFAKKFGGVSGNDSDWFKITIKGFRNGQLTPDSVESFLADFRSQDNTKDTILKGWQWVNLLPLGNIDSLQIELSSSDTGQFGMNTPAYYCIDNFSTTYDAASVQAVNTVLAAKVYPNPASSNIFVETADDKLRSIYVLDAAGKVIANQQVTGKVTTIDLSAYAPGTYILQLVGAGQTGAMRFVKQ